MKFVKALGVMLLLAAAYVGGYGNGRWYGLKEPGKTGSQSTRKVLYWVDPMHPSYTSDKPGIAPDCNMPLEPVYADEKKLEPGVVQISPERQQLIGVRYGIAEISGGSETIIAPGKVAYDERGVVNVNAKVDGWVEKVFVDFVGKPVEKGQPLLTVYSPEMLATQQELLLAGQGQQVMRHSPIAEAKDHAAALVEAARRRLELWDFSPAQIDELLRTRKPVKSFTVYAPASGVVTERKAYENMRVTPEVTLYTLTDLSRIWVLADLYEHDAPKIRVGQTAIIRAAYGNGRAIRARVNFIAPQMNAETRTLQVRLDADNPGQILKPEMFVEVEFRLGLGRRLTVPSDAVLHSGMKQTVFVDAGEGKLLARDVSAGESHDGRTEILRGIKEGERVVTSGNFLIDSESKLRAASLGPGEEKKSEEKKPAAPAPGHVHDD
ncbi:MAG: efflux RND transporter periplasmic adaptor subunit [Acidobacteriia bacterium]|nr:efflux RND transporter periplasmic adaptor subunit [Terriglobia bacterium]